MKPELGDRAFVDSVEVKQEHNHFVIYAEFDGLMFDSKCYDGDLVKWLQAITDRAHNVAMGKE